MQIRRNGPVLDAGAVPASAGEYVNFGAASSQTNWTMTPGAYWSST